MRPISRGHEPQGRNEEGSLEFVVGVWKDMIHKPSDRKAIPSRLGTERFLDVHQCMSQEQMVRMDLWRYAWTTKKVRTR